jgi:curli biogenesis system outer membrane secretion channel CsgG
MTQWFGNITQSASLHNSVKIELRVVRRRAEKITQSIIMPLTSKVGSSFVGPNGSLIGTI